MSLARTRLAALIPLVLSIALQSSILHNYFGYDEFIHFYNLLNYGFLELVLTPHGGHLLATSNSTYFLFHSLFGFEAQGYFLVVLATHALNVFLLFQIVRVLTGVLSLAVFASALWGMSPVAQGALGWFAVYGHVLATTFLLWVLYDVARISRCGAAASRGMLVRWYILLTLAGTSFGFGTVVALSFPFVLYFLLADTRNRTRLAFCFVPLSILLGAAYLAQFWLHGLVSGRPVLHGAQRTLEQLVNAPASSWLPMFVHFWESLGYCISSLLLGGFIATRMSVTAGVVAGPLRGMPPEAMNRLSLAIGGLFLVAVLWSFRSADRARRGVLVGLGLMVAACYATISLRYAHVWSVPRIAGLVGPTLPLAERYHYLGPALVAIALSLLFAQISRLRGWVVWVAFFAWLALAISPYRESIRGFRFPGVRRLHGNELSRIQSSLDVNPVCTEVRIPNRRFPPGPFAIPGAIFPGSAALFLLEHAENVVDGKRVYFVERNPRILEWAHSRPSTRIASLMVGPEELVSRPRRTNPRGRAKPSQGKSRRRRATK